MRTRRQISSANKRMGDHSEALCVNYLRSVGCLEVEQIEDTWYPVGKIQGKRALCQKGGRKLKGDVRALLPGLSLLVECKSREKTLTWGAFEEHQHNTLSLWAKLGHMPMVFWYEKRTRCQFLMPYILCEFKKGQAGLTVDRARSLHCSRASDIMAAAIDGSGMWYLK